MKKEFYVCLLLLLFSHLMSSTGIPAEFKLLGPVRNEAPLDEMFFNLIGSIEEEVCTPEELSFPKNSQETSNKICSIKELEKNFPHISSQAQQSLSGI